MFAVKLVLMQKLVHTLNRIDLSSHFMGQDNHGHPTILQQNISKVTYNKALSSLFSNQFKRFDGMRNKFQTY